jgi:hypothetical protein
MIADGVWEMQIKLKKESNLAKYAKYELSLHFIRLKQLI